MKRSRQGRICHWLKRFSVASCGYTGLFLLLVCLTYGPCSDTEAAEATAGAEPGPFSTAEAQNADEILAADPLQAHTASEQVTRPAQSLTDALSEALPPEFNGWMQPERLAYSVQLVVTMTALGLIPAVLLMTTSYIRISVVLSLLRQAFGSQLLPMQATTALAMFCTGLIMLPTWRMVHERAILPLVQGGSPSDLTTLWDHGIQPVRDFMIRQIDVHGNSDDVHLFVRHVSAGEDYPTAYDQVPLSALLPAFVLSELKTAFLIGFQIYLPFLVIDLVVATVTTSMGMFMLPPNMVSLPLKLLLFLMVDGWRLVIEMLMSSFQ